MKTRKHRHWLLTGSSFVLAAGLVVGIGGTRWDVIHSFFHQEAVPAPHVAEEASAAPTAPPVREALDFHMTDLDHGWLQYTNGYVKTDDGGASWQAEGAGPPAQEASSGAEQDAWSMSELLKLQGAGAASAATPEPQSVTIASGGTYAVKRSQFVTPQVGWVLLADAKAVQEAGLASPVLISVDGGHTWHEAQEQPAQAGIAAEKETLQKLKQEAALYADKAAAQAAIGSPWKLIPSSAAPGDVVLVRHNKPGSVTWLGKAYALKPFGSGYYTYLPITMQAKPGTYPVGDQTLTIQAKKFETQYLKVTKEMESMKQDTNRINADQKKIDAARSKSADTFLFDSDFIQPIEGILTTPYGYTRYVNGKFDSSHMAIDLAADQGTPIKATNDGVVALADNLYLTGNSIYIDHGMGLFSQYAHMSELRVKTGDKVKKGDVIGLVGTTGFSTGPHLHFTFWAHNIQANPNLFFKTNPFHWGQPQN